MMHQVTVLQNGCEIANEESQIITDEENRFVSFRQLTSGIFVSFTSISQYYASILAVAPGLTEDYVQRKRNRLIDSLIECMRPDFVMSTNTSDDDL